MTTPLLLIKHLEMLKVRGFAFAWRLIVADLFMIVTDFIGELSGSIVHGHWFPFFPGATRSHYICGTISTLGYVVILYLLLTEGSRLAKVLPLPIQHGIKSVNLHLISLWGIYPLPTGLSDCRPRTCPEASTWTGSTSPARSAMS